MPPFRRFLVLLLAVIACGVVRAHDPLESTLDLRTTADALEITAILSLPSASGLLKKSADGEITRENFPSRRADLLTAAPRVCALLDADGKSLAPSRTHVSLNSDGEVAYLFEFPASARPASLRIDLLTSLGSGYFFEVTDRTLTPARRTVLVHSKPACTLPVPLR